MWGFFTRKAAKTTNLFKTDLHSHLLPGIDDGVQSFEQAAQIIQQFVELGFTKAITTPHIMSDTYRNTPEIIQSKLDELRLYLKSRSIIFSVEAAAEYYFDEVTSAMAVQGKPFLTFGEKYLLFETNTFSDPLLLNDFIFQLKVKGYQPVMAHPERYKYLQNNLDRVQDLIDRGVLMQVNSLSLSGFYSRPVQKSAIELVKNKMVHFLGSDCHSPRQADLLKDSLRSKHFQKALELPLLNYSL